MVSEINSIDSIRKGTVVVDFYTTTCGPCKAMNPILEAISNEFTNVKVAKVEVTQNPEVSQMFGVMSVPTVIIMKDCQVKHVLRGLSTKEMIRSAMKQYAL